MLIKIGKRWIESSTLDESKKEQVKEVKQIPKKKDAIKGGKK